MKKKNKSMSAFDRMIMEMTKEYNGNGFLDEYMAVGAGFSKRIPLRYRIIAEAFVEKLTLEELNQNLMDAGCARLYTRSPWDAGLIYAFLNGMEYTEWREMHEKLTELLENSQPAASYFREKSITCAELKRYLTENSQISGEELRTMHMTRIFQRQITDLDRNEKNFLIFLQDNLNRFCDVREKTRYYFCKYLYFMLLTRIQNYTDCIWTESDVQDAVTKLAVFKSVTQLKRKKTSPEESRRILEQASISCGEIFNEFNYFYFEYVSLDWMEVMIEYYGNISQLPPEQKQKLAASLRRYNADYMNLPDEEVIRKKQQELDEAEAELDNLYSLEDPKKGYQQNRTGENVVRKYIRGTLDIDRTSLICFLIFFGHEAVLTKKDEINRERLSDILKECGFSALNENDGFDYFIIKYLESRNPVEYLMQQVTEFALEEENFYLYHMYQSSRNAGEDFKKLTVKK